MMKRETIPIADVYVPIKRRATLEQKRVDELAASILRPGRKPMRRRDVVKLILTSLAFDPLAARAQRAIPVIGALSPAARPAQFETSFYVGFSQGMRDLGYVEGRDYLIEWRFAGGDYARLPELASELIALKVNVLFATSTMSILAAHKATTNVPIVMGYYEDDPTAEQGLVASLARPAGNVTGLAAMGLQIVSKHLEFIKAILPSLSCLVPDFDGASSSHDSKEALWDKFYTAAPPRGRQSVEQYKIVKRA